MEFDLGGLEGGDDLADFLFGFLEDAPLLPFDGRKALLLPNRDGLFLRGELFFFGLQLGFFLPVLLFERLVFLG